jgi:hypothetical protein
MGYASNRSWSDRFTPAVLDVVHHNLRVPVLAVEANPYDDCHHATDIYLRADLPAGRLDIGARVRKNRDLAYAHQFTMRCCARNGGPTEIHKVIDGFMDYMVYGFADPTGPTLVRWSIFDMAVFRAADRHLADRRENGDGTAFNVYNVADFPDGFVVASSRALTPDTATV